MSEETEEILKDIRKWVKVLAHDKIKDELCEFSEEEKKIYELSVPENSQKDISKYVEYAKRTVGTKQKEWYSLGIMEKIDKYGGRYVRLASLEDFGIDIPDIETMEE